MNNPDTKNGRNPSDDSENLDKNSMAAYNISK
jgi:hypothetical protein